MSYWKIAAAQYEPLHTSVTEHVAHHLQFIHAAAQCQCELLVFLPSHCWVVLMRMTRFLPHPMKRC